MARLEQDPVALTRQLVDIPSLTGQEEAVGDLLLEGLRKEGWTCSRQELSGQRFNVLAVKDEPCILFSTHMDTVPPFMASDEDQDEIKGRGSCDAKGQIAAMICAARQLGRQGHSDLGLLFLVGEETDSAGARLAAGSGLSCSWIINGEPTDNHLVSAHKGVLGLRLSAEGKAAHSGYPQRGESALDKLLDVLQALRRHRWPEDALLGSTYLNVGLIEGGRAANVIPDRAHAEVALRCVVPCSRYLEDLQHLASAVRVDVLTQSDPQRMHVEKGFPVKTVGFGTDIPYLREIATPLLYGPGSIFDAHTEQEKLNKNELLQGVQGLVRLVLALKSRSERLD
ncbi:MAG TPA: M20/M25/M40 family metallo-hydrolase [Acidobacteriota bacterium]|nr:M20/M25/M40 family metallo-hydrolase [Acidobacteriota bacterium]